MSDTSIINLSGYRIVHLDSLPDMQLQMKSALASIGVKGTIMLATEGINISLAGTAEQAHATRLYLDQDQRFNGIWLKESVSNSVPFLRLRVRIRHEIIAFDGQDSEHLHTQRPQAPTLAPTTLRDWLDKGKDFTLLDARNDYEIVSGTFPGSTHLNIKQFRNFKAAVKNALAEGRLDPGKPLVTYCTGGIRCEKAAPWLLENGFKEVFQVDGGVLNYFETCSGKHWEGDCFVFDNRVELDKQLKPTGAGLCYHCQLAVPEGTECRCQLGRH